jgi:hypothetical protein
MIIICIYTLAACRCQGFLKEADEKNEQVLKNIPIPTVYSTHRSFVCLLFFFCCLSPVGWALPTKTR